MYSSLAIGDAALPFVLFHLFLGGQLWGGREPMSLASAVPLRMGMRPFLLC
jgi:hypothetical protein